MANGKVFIRKSYINYFVLAEWNLNKEELYVYFENEQKLEKIRKIIGKTVIFKVGMRKPDQHDILGVDVIYGDEEQESEVITKKKSTPQQKIPAYIG